MYFFYLRCRCLSGVNISFKRKIQILIDESTTFFQLCDLDSLNDLQFHIPCWEPLNFINTVQFQETVSFDCDFTITHNRVAYYSRYSAVIAVELWHNFWTLTFCINLINFTIPNYALSSVPKNLSNLFYF